MSKIYNDFIRNKWLFIYSFILAIAIFLVALLFSYLFNGDESAQYSYVVIKEYFYDISKTIGFVTVILAVYHLGINNKKFNFNVIESCISRFNEINVDFDRSKNDEELLCRTLKKYVDLVNEELFYIKNGRWFRCKGDVLGSSATNTT
ncbi:hypothetical protein CEQ90_20495 [Lewinellaceae bacterium SD302]|nr:hypothetical protein CEQ90_20495 [Lewinellaceae bacterium SD302]